MNHNQFSNGTFDVGRYDSTMDSSFYPKRRYNQDSNRYLGKMYDDNTIDEDESSTTAQMRTGNANFNPALNNKFKKRAFGKPLQLDRRKASQLQKQLMTNRGNDSEEDISYKVPSINKNGGNSSRMSRILNRNPSKGPVTTRNRNLAINQSLGNISRIRDSLDRGPINLGLFSNDSDDNIILHNTIDPRGHGSYSHRKPFIAPRKEPTEYMVQMQNKIAEFKDIISKKDAQIDFLKRTVEFTNINEMQQENSVLYSE
jgi:hypothetical protein